MRQLGLSTATTSAVKPSIWYDRTIPDEFRAELSPGGRFERLVRFARGRGLADVQLRATGSLSWATIYCGLTNVLHLEYRKTRGYRLRADNRHMDANRDGPPEGILGWTTWSRADQLMAGWPAIETYMTGLFKGVAERFINEGAVQAMLCANGGESYQVIDREAVFGFRDTAERERVHTALRTPLLDALDVPTPEDWWRPPANLGGELDVLAVDARGRLLVMEVKPAHTLTGITWAPLQVTFYARLFRHWSEAVGEEAAEILNRMLRQRIAIGLEEESSISLSYPLEIVPVVAIQDPVAHPRALARLGVVQDRLLETGQGWDNLEVWLVRPSVAIKRHPVG
jgi:hypothetical protein